jgi:hypothetical protein
MSTTNPTTNSGDGTRPTTAGGVDNIGGASSFTPGKAQDGASSTPAADEKMTEKRQESGDGHSATASHPGPINDDKILKI